MTADKNFEKLLEQLARAFTLEMPYTKDMKLEVDHFTEDEAVLRFPMASHLIGNMAKKILHGGVAATVLDTTCGMLAMGIVLSRNKTLTFEDQMHLVSRTATADMRVDYLRPGRGEYFIVKATIVRAGNKLSAIRGDLYNDQDEHIATSIGNYTMAV